MRRNLPPLNPLRTFEAAGRYRSFTAAAEELGVTQVAVSRQVRALEEYFGLTLFRRSHRSIALTEEGELLLPSLTRALDDIDSAVAAVSRRGRKDLLSIHSYATFYQRWLIPRLALFHQEFPNIELRLSTISSSADLDRQNIDAMIRSGDGDWPGMEATHLVDLDLVPVCSPALLKAATDNGERSFDITQQTLLHSISRPKDWASWCAAYGVTNVDPTKGLKFQNSGLAYEAALLGMGVALGIRSLVQQNLDDGALVAPIPFAHQVAGGYYLIHPSENIPSPALAAFKSWLLRLAKT